MIKTESLTAAEWRAIQAALLADVEQWQQLAVNADTQPGVPALLATDYGMTVREACLKAARAAQTAADQAAVFAAELEALAVSA